MMKRFATAAAILFVTVAANAQQTSPSYFMPFVSQATDASVIAMGGVAGLKSPKSFAALGNMASSAWSDGVFELGASGGLFGAGEGTFMQALSFGVSSMLTDRLSLALAFSSELSSPYQITDENGMSAGMFTPGNMLLGGGVSSRVLPFLSIGANASYAEQALSPDVTSRTAVLGISGAAEFGGMSVCAALSDFLLTRNQGVVSPANANLSADYTYIAGQFGIRAAAGASYYIFSPAFSAGTGLELDWKKMVFLRAGYRYGGVSPLPSYFSAGLGLCIRGVRADVAYIGSKAPFRNSIVMTISYKLDKKWKSSKEEQ